MHSVQACVGFCSVCLRQGRDRGAGAVGAQRRALREVRAEVESAPLFEALCSTQFLRSEARRSTVDAATSSLDQPHRTENTDLAVKGVHSSV